MHYILLHYKDKEKDCEVFDTDDVEIALNHIDDCHCVIHKYNNGDMMTFLVDDFLMLLVEEMQVFAYSLLCAESHSRAYRFRIKTNYSFTDTDFESRGFNTVWKMTLNMLANYIANHQKTDCEFFLYSHINEKDCLCFPLHRVYNVLKHISFQKFAELSENDFEE